MLQFQEDVLLAPYSTFRIGGRAKYFVELKEKNDVVELANVLQQDEFAELPRLFLGGGSNIIFADDGFAGIVIKNSLIGIEHLGDDLFIVSAGVPNALLYQEARKLGYDFAPWYTIPGTVGGAVAGNAGVPGFATGDYVTQVEVLDFGTRKAQDPPQPALKEGEGSAPTVRLLPNDFFDFKYRHTVFHAQPELRQQLLITRVWLQLPAADSGQIQKSADHYMQQRKEKQPWGKTGGSFFKNPNSEQAAGYLLDQCECKGLQVGGAFFSEKHANFLMNDGTATQADVLELGRLGKQKVQGQFGVELENEVRIIDTAGGEISV